MADLAGLLPILTKVAGLASTGAGLYNSYENAQEANQARGIIENPAKFQKFAAGYTQPLTAGLTQGVENQAQGYAAERGLASSPALEQQIVAQALAPYIQQQQNQGQSNALEVLNMMAKGGGSVNPASLTSGLQSLSGLFSNPNAQLNQIKSQASQDQLPQETLPPGVDWSIPDIPMQNVDLTGWSFGG